ncbi:acyl-CoA dehydrogenase [Rhodococcus gordoniae]|uniref:Acyl-CoA dehydrogenase n=1 Tax=Rhodococcus gordoniae TaxID=223392 RepID=A0A379M2G7_9NOCA|nr:MULTISPECIES: acyl-CoA dehydrogenase family protein [Rhodococcus]UTT48406.1 acyl-CoA/acyl-ACP dehydrogenase [Rhodococcus gordoniae]SUE15803.1 acyl-CoA dehydrogenase [Rhodococcus gordoniae]
MTSVSAPLTVSENTELSLLARAEIVGRESAGPAAAEVDREGRFPHEAVDALRAYKLLNCAVPVEQGGEGASLGELCAVARILGRYCASTAMIFAMHQTQILSLVRHSTPGVAAFVAEAVAKDYLIASATTELGTGGDVRSSVCALTRDGETVSLTKNAPVISYGEYADAILVTARRTADSPPSDQALVVCRRDGVTLEPTGSWDTLGLRGTCSPGFVLTGTTSADLVVGASYAEISSRTMLPVSHSVWSAVWLGIADATMEKARSFVRSAARRSPGVTPPGALRLAEAAAVHQQFADLVAASAARFDAAASAQDESMSGMGFSLAMNNLKVTASTLVVDLVNRAMLVCGIAGYREDSQYSLGRHLRDAHGAAVMVNNDRIMNNSAQMSIAYRGTL